MKLSNQRWTDNTDRSSDSKTKTQTQWNITASLKQWHFYSYLMMSQFWHLFATDKTFTQVINNNTKTKDYLFIVTWSFDINVDVTTWNKTLMSFLPRESMSSHITINSVWSFLINKYNEHQCLSRAKPDKNHGWCWNWR